MTLEGGDLVVEFFVPQSLDVAGALHELRHQLRNPAFGSVQGAMAGSSVAEVRMQDEWPWHDMG